MVCQIKFYYNPIIFTNNNFWQKWVSPNCENQQFMVNMCLQSWNGHSYKILLQSNHFYQNTLLKYFGKIGYLRPQYAKNQHFMVNICLQSWDGPPYKILLQSDNFYPNSFLAPFGKNWYPQNVKINILWWIFIYNHEKALHIKFYYNPIIFTKTHF